MQHFSQRTLMGELRAVAWHKYDPDDLNMSLFSKGGDLPKGSSKGSDPLCDKKRAVFDKE